MVIKINLKKIFFLRMIFKLKVHIQYYHLFNSVNNVAIHKQSSHYAKEYDQWLKLNSDNGMLKMYNIRNVLNQISIST